VKLRALAPGKVNLGLFLGATREDGRHRLVTVFESLSLADTLEIEVLGEDASDVVICPGVKGENLAARALAGLRQRGWDGPPVSLTIEKRIPVAAGMAGGSADAAAALRLAMAVAPGRAEEVDQLAATLGADVPSQLLAGVSVGTGAGELVERFEALAEHAFVVLPSRFALSTGKVFHEADRLRVPRSDAQLGGIYRDVVEALAPGARIPDALLTNDLQAAAISLCPACADALADLEAAGADHAIVSGSGPTVVGIWWGAGAESRAAAAAAELRDRHPDAVVATPVAAEFAAPSLI
jgi:4-diphosphocytidyl-2-C-methyl-D-erythritol kinase